MLKVLVSYINTSNCLNSTKVAENHITKSKYQAIYTALQHFSQNRFN